MSKKKSDEVAITLSPLQVEQVMRSAGRNRNGTVSNLLLAALNHAYQPIEKNGGKGRPSPLQKATRAALEDALEDPQLSQSLLRGLAILASYGPDRPWRAIIDLAGQLGMSPSTTHRYVKTLRAVGLLEQNPETREYRPVDGGVTLNHTTRRCGGRWRLQLQPKRGDGRGPGQAGSRPVLRRGRRAT